MHKVTKWIAIVLGGTIGVLIMAVIALLIFGQLTFKPAMKDRPLYPVSANTSPEGLERGKYLIENVMGCAGACHTPEDGPSFSGVSEDIALGPAVINFSAPNLTSDDQTGLGTWSDAEIARAIREGIGRDGRALEVMPSFNYHNMSDADISAVVGYLRNLPPVRNEVPEIKANAFGKALLALGLLMPEPVGVPITSAQLAPQPGSVDYGAYLTSVAACRDCHSLNLQGGQNPAGNLYAPDLTISGNLTTWNEQDFLVAMRTGKLPEGRYMSPEMPYQEYGKMIDEDLLAIFSYLNSLPGKQ
jgi:mono/diheme cytochrome c family protein